MNEAGMTSPKPEKNLLKIAISKKKNIEQQKEYDLSRRAQIDLERLISEIKAQESVDLIGEHPAAATIDLPRVREVGNILPIKSVKSELNIGFRLP
ncbi:unnamed protein product [Strongylus vulgaris]|uniref:Uncharacterized protein n=1 Tax=Strongylus vulgaris TaxID=40348 RepID=A0A3P7JPC6_STRVU|nr:unnamed protein product [Strongylus vulgaris]